MVENGSRLRELACRGAGRCPPTVLCCAPVGAFAFLVVNATQFAEGKKMPIYRNVSKADAPTQEAAAQFILDDTGGVVQYASAWPIVEEEDCWRVPVFSSDGRASMPFPVGAVFPNDNRMSDVEIEKQINQ